MRPIERDAESRARERSAIACVASQGRMAVGAWGGCLARACVWTGARIVRAPALVDDSEQREEGSAVSTNDKSEWPAAMRDANVRA